MSGRARIQAAAAGMVLALAVGCVVAGPVDAQDRGHDERDRGDEARGHDERRGHERRDFRDRDFRDYDRGGRGFGYDAPVYGGYYAPPTVYAPPPPSPGIGLFFNFR
jgi:hypothetical protein